MEQNLYNNGWLRFDIEKFIEDLKTFKDYFIKDVKIVNGIQLMKKGFLYKFYLSTPSMTILLKLHNDDIAPDCYLNIDLDDEITGIPITEEEHNRILDILMQIHGHHKRNKEIFDKARANMIKKIFKSKDDKKQ